MKPSVSELTTRYYRDFDLGLPTGPLASSETLTFADGVLVAAELIIDSTSLRPSPNTPPGDV